MFLTSFMPEYISHISLCRIPIPLHYATHCEQIINMHDYTWKSNMNSAFLDTSQLLDAVMYLCHREQPQYMSFVFSSLAGTTEQPCYSRNIPPERQSFQSTHLLSFLCAHPLVAIHWCHLLNFDVQAAMAGIYERQWLHIALRHSSVFEFPGVDQTTTHTTN